MDPELTDLLELAKRAGPLERIDYAKPIARHGADAVAAMGPWLADPRLCGFAVRVIAAAAEHGARDEARTVLLGALDEPVTPGLGDDLVWFLDRLDPGWRRRRRPRPVRADSAIGKLAKDPTRPRRYMHAWTLWHRIVDQVTASDGRLRYIGACHRWNNEGYVDSGSRRIQPEPPAGEYCYLCDQAESRLAGSSSGVWASIRAPWVDAGERLHLRREKVWHLAVTDDMVVPEALGAMYLTECGWWIERERVTAEGVKRQVSPICDVCVDFARERAAQ